MFNHVDLKGKPFHFIGVGGIGMSALAYILAKRQLPVSGSDIRSSHITQRLQAVGAHIFNHQEAKNLEFFPSKTEKVNSAIPIGVNNYSASSWKPKSSLKNETTTLPCPQVICSTAISSTNVEYQAAQQRGYPIFHRSDLLAALIQEYESIAVAGTHGKTTTSSLLGYVLFKANLDPTIIIGGEVDAWEGNAHLGQGPFLVAEADESDGSLTKLAPSIGIVTNIELDHPDHYQSLEDVVKIFHFFANHCKTLVGCIDCQTVREQLKPKISYSLSPELDADYTVKQINYQAQGTTAEVWERGTVLGTLRLKLLGQHNLSNALAVVAVGRQLGLEFEVISEAIASFTGAKRRFECKGKAQGITFVDDYAHHPSEIQATLGAARLQVQSHDPNSPSRVVAIFQPHRYSRTITFLEEFAQSFNNADLVIITDIYSAGEENKHKITAQQVVEAISDHHSQVYYQPDFQGLKQFLTEILVPGDLALFLGAGNLNQIIPEIVRFYDAK